MSSPFLLEGLGGIPGIKMQRGSQTEYPFTAPVIDSGGQVYNVKALGAKGDGTTDDTTAILSAMAEVGPTGGALVFPPGSYLISLPLKYYQTSATTGQLAPSLLGGWGKGGSSTDIGQVGPVKFVASSSFPTGEFLIDYIGSQTTVDSPLTGFGIQGFALECNSRAAGIRLCNEESAYLGKCVINGAVAPNPANTAGSPTGAVSLVAGSNNSAYNNVVEDVYVYHAGNAGFCMTEGGGSSVTARNCSSIGNSNYGFITTPATTLITCDSQSNGIAGYYVNGGKLIGCTTLFANNGNAVLLDHAYDFSTMRNEFLACSFFGTNSDQGTEAKNALIRIKWQENRTQFTNCKFIAEGATSDWVYIDSGAVSSSIIAFNGCDFDPTNGAVTNVPFNFNGNTSVIVNNSPGINPQISYALGNVTGATTFNRINGWEQSGTLTGNITVTLTSGLVVGDTMKLVLTQDGTGSRTATWPSNFKKAGGSLVLSTGAGAVDAVSMVWDGTNWRETARALNQS
jgi:hypothetical protein